MANILQMRFIRDRIKIFLQKQRPNSGKKSRPSSGKKDAKVSKPKKTEEVLAEDFDTLKVEVKFKFLLFPKMAFK